MKSNAQVSVEFIIVLSLLFGVLLLSLAVFGEKNSGFILLQKGSEAQLEARKISLAVNSVFLAGNGAETEIALGANPDSNILFSGNAVQVHWSGGFADSALITENINAASFSGTGTATVKNIEGVVSVEKA
ncbi:MAG TPA: hypothetical protein VFF09_03515 [archaeon]|nr:hypothetical protein [archaeon]